MHSVLAALGLFSLCFTFKCKEHASHPDVGYSQEGNQNGDTLLSVSCTDFIVCLFFIVVFFSLK